jgi:hypothetical protein
MLIRPVVILKRLRLEPFAAVRNPPTERTNRRGGGNGPPKRQCQIRNQTNDGERHPKYLALHTNSLTAKAGVAGDWKRAMGAPCTANFVTHKCQFAKHNHVQRHSIILLNVVVIL